MSQNRQKFLLLLFVIAGFGNHAITGEAGKFDLRGNLTENYSSQGVKLHITSEKSRYYTDENIRIDCHIGNTGLYPVTLYLNNDNYKNFTFVIRNSNGQSLPLKASLFKKAREKDNGQFYGSYTATDYNSRAIVLQPGESIVKSFLVNNLVELETESTSSKNLTVMAFFYPNPDQANQYYISSDNEYGLRLDPRASTLVKAGDARDILPYREFRITPKEVIYLMLTAEYEKNWLDYFKYVDLQEVIRDYPDFARKYTRSPREYQGLILEDFRKFLMSNAKNKLIRFEVVSQTLDKGNARVSVRAMREIDGFDRDFLYTYYLSPKDSLWQVSGIEAQLLK